MPTLIHVGWPKAASTFLQETVFFPQSETLYLGRPTPKFFPPGSPERDKAEFFIRLKGALYVSDECAYAEFGRPRLAALQEELRTLVKKVSVDGESLIVSDEGFTNLAGNGRVDRGRKAERLQEFFGEAKILFVIRRQDSMLESRYGSYLRQVNRLHPYCSFEEYVRLALQRYAGLDPICQREGLVCTNLRQELVTRSCSFAEPITVPLYEPVIREYERQFGRHNILVMPFEELVSDMPAALARLSDMTGMHLQQHESAQFSKRTNTPNRYEYGLYRARKYRSGDWLFRALAKFRLAGTLEKLPYLKQRVALAWPDGLREAVMEFYRPGNQRLSADYGLGLEQHGYL